MSAEYKNKMRNGKLKAAVMAALFSFSLFGISNAVIAAGAPIELSADTIEYNAKTDMANASGGVTITRDGGVLTGAQASYNFKTQEVNISGGVTANKDDMNLKANSLISTADKEMIATGDVVVVKGENTLTGPEIRYNQNTSDISMPSGGHASGPQAEIRGDVLNGNLNAKEYHAVGDVYLSSKTNDVQSTSDTATYTGDGANFNFVADGNVHINSDSRNMYGQSDHATYSSADDGKLVMTGNAQATQNGNIVRGNTLTVYMGDNVSVK